MCIRDRDFAIHCVKEFKKQGTLISFDVNYRSNLWTGEEARKCIETILPYVDIFFCSEDTARLTFGKTGTINEIQKSFCEEYPISVVASTEMCIRDRPSFAPPGILFPIIWTILYLLMGVSSYIDVYKRQPFQVLSFVRCRNII